MKNTKALLLLALFVLIAASLFFTGCSDMMEKLGNISLTIVLDTPNIVVASYVLEGEHTDTASRIVMREVIPPRHSLSALKKGTWDLTVTAYDANSVQLGRGTTRVNLKEGQILETTLLVVFTQAVLPSSGFSFEAPSRFDSADGQLTGTTPAMEYKLSSSDAPYTPCTEGTTILGTGTYLVRYAAAHGLHASEPISVTVPAFQPIQLTIGSPNLTMPNKVYDGTTAVEGTISAGSLIGNRASDVVSVSALATYDTKAAGTGKQITVTYSLAGPDAPNYLAPGNTTVSASIAKKQLTVSGTTVTAIKTYDGTNSAAVTSQGILTGVVAEDSVSSQATATYTTKDAGTGKHISLSYTLDGTDKDNYLAPVGSTATETGVIMHKQLSVSNLALAASKVYDGTTSVATPTFSLVGKVLSEDITVAATATYARADAENNNPITIIYSLSGADKDNYLKPADDASTTGEIAKKQLIVTETDLTTSKVYDGTTTAAISSVTFTGKVADEDVTVSAAATYDAVDAADDREITVTYTLAGSDAANYLKPVHTKVVGTIQKKPLTVTGTTVSPSKVYDGTAPATLTSKGTLFGVLPSDTVTFTASAAYDSADAGEGKTVTTSYVLDGPHGHNYYVPENTSLIATIAKRQLTVSGTTVTSTKAYDGTTSVEVGENGTLSDVVSGDVVTVSARAAYTSAEVGEDRPITVSYSLGGSHATNYLKPADDTTLVGIVTKKQLIVSGTDLVTSKVYDGTTSASISSVNFTGKVADEDVMVGATATYGSPNAGNSNPITVIYSLSGADKDNYLKPTDDASTTGEIAKKQLIVTETDLTTSKVYDGTTTAAISSVTFTGKVADEDVSVGATATYASPDAGSGTAILTTYSLRGSKSANYLKPNDSLDAGTIQKMPLTVIWTTVSPSKVYDGTAQATLTSKGLLGGVLPSDTVSFTASAAYDSADAGEGKTVTASYVLDGPHGHNYYVPENTSLIATIAKRQLTVSGTTVTSTKAYDGTTSAKVNIHGNLAEYISEDNVWVQATATYDAKAVGTGKRISLTYTVNGTDKDNYLAPIGSTATETGVITPKQLKATNYTSPPYKEYDGTTASAAPTFTLLDMVSSDDVRLTATATFVSPDVNPRQSISVAYALEGADKDNYIIPEFMPAIDHAEIMAKPLTIGLPSFPAGKTYDGTRAVTGTVTLGSLSGVVSDDVVTVSAVASYDSAAVATNNHITFIYTLSGTDAGNYRKPNNHWLLAPVTKAVLTATVGDYSKVYGEANPTFTVFVTGFVNGESTSTATGYVAPTAYSSATTTTNAGTSIISITGGSATNYSFNINDTGTLTIEKPLGPSMSDTLVGYYPASPSSPSIINLTGFSTNLTNLEASVAIDGSSFGTYAVVEVDSRNRAMILPNEGVAVTSATKVRVRVKETSTQAAGPAKEFGLTSQALSVGDYYQGGVVAYFFESWEPGYQAGQVHGLIAAKSDISTSKIAWSNSTTTIVGTEGGIGRGLANTDKIVTSLGGSAGSYAAGMTRAYRGGGYSDWFLPTRDELWKLRINYNLIGNFATPAASFYWSSTEELRPFGSVYTGDTVIGYEFTPNANNAVLAGHFWKTDTHLVRAVRYF